MPTSFRHLRCGSLLLLLLLISCVSSFSTTAPWRRPPQPSRSTTLLQMVTLYGHPGSRSPLVNWACYELGVEVEMGDLRRNPHPFGQIPCLTDGNDNNKIVVFESGAILAYLVQTYSSDALTAAQQASIVSWITWSNASLDPICFLETPDNKVYDTGLRHPNKRMDQLDAILAEQQGVLVPSAGFSVADVAVASYLLYVVQFFPQVSLAAKWPHVVQFMKDAANRPTYGQAFGTNLQEALVERLQLSLDTAGLQ